MLQRIPLPSVPLAFLAAAMLAAAPAAAQDAEGPAPPPGADAALAQLNASPRHGDWHRLATGDGDTIRSWIVFPERSTPAPVVIVVHEIMGLTDWVRAVADQLAAEGFIAVAPDFLSMAGVPRTPTGEPERDPAVAAVRALDADWVQRQIAALAAWATSLPAATDSYGIVGYCWGGSTVWRHAVHAPGLGAGVVYYGTAPVDQLASVRAPVLGLYGGDDARVNATIPATDSTMTALDKTYEPHIFPGAGHGFLRQQDGRDGANRAASVAAWPMTIAWFRRYLEGGGDD